MAIIEKNYIQDKLAQSGVDISDGSAIYDLLISPLNQINERFKTENSSKINKFSRLDANSMTEDDVNFLGSHFLISRSTGTKATGTVKFYFSTRVSVNILKDAVVVAGTKRYIILNTHIISKSALVFESPYYTVDGIQIQALVEGSDYNQPSNTTFTYEGYIQATPVKILNTTAISNGVSNESNVDMLDRIQRSVFGTFLGAPESIKDFIKINSPTVEDVTVISGEHPLMLRDLVYDITDGINYNIENFSHVKAGIPIVGYDKLHKAYEGVFKDTDPGLSVGFPSTISEWITEFSTGDYNIISKEDAVPKITEKLSIMSTFLSDTILNTGIYSDSASLIMDGWILKDGSTLDNELIRSTDISLRGGYLVIGKNYTTETFVSYTKTLELIDSIGKTLIKTSKDKDILVKSIKTKLFPMRSSNSSPVITKQLSQHRGIKIVTTTLTTDLTELGSMAYITIMKNTIKYSPYDGYGLAWRKQPEYLIRMQHNNYTDLTLKAEDLKTFNKETNRSDGEDFLGRLTGVDVHPEAASVLKYNLYVVDNNLLDDKLWISNTQIWGQNSGKNQFLAASKKWVEHDIEYNITLVIGENLGVQVWFGSDYAADSADLIFGPTSPAYIPSAFENLTVNEMTGNRSHFGFGVLNTENYEWYYKNLEISSIINTFPAHLFRFDVSNFNPANGATIKYYGSAYDPLNESVPYSSSLTFGIWNETSGTWDTDPVNWVNTNEPFPYNPVDHKIEVSLATLTDYVNSEGFLYIAAMASNYNDVNHILQSYYVEISDSEYTGVHKGNASDIYVYDPENIEIGYATFIVENHIIDFTDNSAALPYICEILDITETYSGIRLPNNDWAVVTIPTTSWSIRNSIRQRGLEYSSSNKFQISFTSDAYNNASLKVRYRYLSTGGVLNTSISNDLVRQPAVNSLIKASPLAIIYINSLRYSGDVGRSTMVSLIKTYINTMKSTRFEKSDLVNFMYSSGASYVDLDMDISIRLYNTLMEFSTIELTAQYYELPSTSIAKFFTDTEELVGVTKL